MKTLKSVLVWGLLLLAGTDLWAIPAGFNIQGRLTYADGVNKGQNINENCNITFSLYAGAAGGTPLWVQTQDNINVKNGNFQVVLRGAGTNGKSIEEIAPGLPEAYIEIKVNDDPPLAPRQPLLRSPLEANNMLASYSDVEISGDNDANGSGAILLKTGSADRLVVTSGGNVGIGVSQPAQKLSVNGAVQSLSGGFKFPDGSVQASSNCAFRLKVVSAPCSYSDSPSGSSVSCSGRDGFVWSGIVFALCYSCNGSSQELCGPQTTMHFTEAD